MRVCFFLLCEYALSGAGISEQQQQQRQATTVVAVKVVEEVVVEKESSRSSYIGSIGYTSKI